MDMLTEATNRSGYVVKSVITDEVGVSATPASATWSLTDGSGTEINGRTDVLISSLSSTMYISLGKDDLDSDDGSMRHFALTATYVSSLTGRTEDLRSCTRFVVTPC